MRSYAQRHVHSEPKIPSHRPQLCILSAAPPNELVTHIFAFVHKTAWQQTQQLLKIAHTVTQTQAYVSSFTC